MYNFFIPDEDELKRVIQQTLQGKDDFVDAKVIQTGWTNITMDVHGVLHDYIFRFPRNLFFAKMMIKDCTFCNFLKDKVTLPVPDMSLNIDQNRPFSVHQKIVGTPLIARLDNLSQVEQNSVIEDISQFLVELHSLPISSMPQEIQESLSDFLAGLATVNKGQYDLTRHMPLQTMEQQTQELAIIHGDFHPGNILIHEGRVSAVIDFSFASVSNRHADLGRFAGRSNPTLSKALIESYHRKAQCPCNTQKIQDVVDIFKYVEYKYVQYMQSNHPEIKIPQSVLQASAMVAAAIKAE